MLLSLRPLKDLANVNSFEVDQVFEVSEGDEFTIFFQLIDASLDSSREGYNPPGRRYMPVAGATLALTLDNLDDSKVITRFATQPFAQDPSIWQFDVITSDAGKLHGTPTIRLKLTEGGKVTYGQSKGTLLINSQKVG